MTEERPEHFVQSLERGLAVIRAFGPERPAMTLSDVARVSGVTRAAARRFLLTLSDLGYVRTDGRLFSLTPRVLDLGYAYLSSIELPGLAEPHLERLVKATGESSSMSVLDGDDIVYISRVAATRIMAVAINVGTRFPAYATSMGRVLLAALDDTELEARLARIGTDRPAPATVSSIAELRRRIEDVRVRGHALVDQELEPGLRAIAVPVRDRSGAVVAAINVSSHVSRMTQEKARKEFLPLLQEAAAEIERDLARR